MRPIFDRSMPEAAIAFSPAAAAASVNDDVVGPLPSLADAGERLEQARLALGALVERGEAGVDLVGRDHDRCLVELDGDDRDVIETEVGVLDHLVLGFDRMGSTTLLTTAPIGGPRTTLVSD